MLKKTKLILITLFILLSGATYSFRASDFELVKNLELFASMFKELNAYYVDEIEPEKLIRTGIDAMLGSLDPYTSYISEEDIASYKLQTTGKYGGIGALIRQSGDYVLIAEPYEDFPAFKAGLRAGDKILTIAGESAKGKNTDDVSKLLKGVPNTAVQIEVERLGEDKPIAVTLERAEIQIKSVPYFGMLNDKIGYIRLNNFTEQCSKEVIDALKKLKSEKQATAIVLDLRSNPGGLLNEAIDVANIFLPRSQEIVSTKSRKREWDKTYKTKKRPQDTDIPLAVLINRGSASASEIVSGVMQDLDRGIVIGKRSFGKGLVQTTKNVGYNSKVKMTTAKYYLPSGRGIQAIDYSGGYSDKLEQIPDSLRTAFKTENGRTVYDAGGVDPDIDIETPLLGNVTASLRAKQLLFDYATLYRSQHNTLSIPKEFELTSTDFQQFTTFLVDKDYEYVTESEQLLKNLREQAAEEKYLDAIATEIEALEKQIQHDKEKDLEKFEEEITNLLEQEIASRYYYQKGRLEEQLEDDLAVKKAIEVLGNSAEYNKLLKK